VAGSTFVLVPGAGGAAWYWHRTAAELRGRGHRVIAVDLPAEDDSAGLAEYADAVVAAASAAGVPVADGLAAEDPSALQGGPLVLVAQSMAGLIAPALGQRLPVSLVVLLNAMIPAPGETGGQWWENTGQAEAQRELDRREGRPVDADFEPRVYFLHDVPQSVLDEALAHAPDQSETPFRHPLPEVSWPDVPIRVLAGRDDRFFPVEFQRRVARERLGVEVDEVPGGHLAALSYPVELADRLEAYLADNAIGVASG
jgi:pimeloyl-ACP methyl ester carboxylesterase